MPCTETADFHWKTVAPSSVFKKIYIVFVTCSLKLLTTLLDRECGMRSLTFTGGKDRAAWCVSCAQTQIMLPQP